MDFNIDTIFGLGGFVIAILGVVGTGWWRMTVMVKDAKRESAEIANSAVALASLARQEIAEHRLHVAESYVSKEGLREALAPVMDALGGLGTQLSEMRSRIDRAFDKTQTTPRARA